MTSDDPKDSVQTEEVPAKPMRHDSRFRRLVRQSWWRAHWLLPNIVPPHYENESTYWDKRERESNEASRVPDDEELRLRVMWGLELFGPSEVELLYKSLARLKWTAGFATSKTDGALNWVRHQRAYGGSGGWYNVGIVAGHSDRQRFMMLDNYALLPAEVDYLLVRIFQLTPSLTCVLVGFVLKEQTARSYEIELNRDRKTVRERSRRRWVVSTLGPEHLKRRSIEQARSKIQNLVGRWFQANLPGFFCGLSDSRMPTAELVTTCARQLLSDEHHEPRGINFGWRHLLENFSPFDVWTYAECPALRFSTGGHGFANESFHLVVALCTSEVPEDSLKYMGGRESGSYVAYCHDLLDGILSNYAGVAFLKEVSKDLKSSRADLKISRLHHRSGVSVLERIHSFFDRSLGTPAVATELRDRSKHLGLYQHECSRFISPKWTKDKEQREIAKDLCEQTQFMATRVIVEEHSTREHFEQLSSILSVRESIKAQQRMEWLTVIALVVATSSLILALNPTKDWPSQIRSYLVSFGLAGK